MKIAQSLSALSLRPLLANGTSSPEGGGDFGKRLLNDHAPRLNEALARATDQAWKALEVALAGPAWWQRAKVLLEPGEELSLGEPVEAFLAGVPLADLSEEARSRCLHELRAARKSGLLTGGDVAHPLPEEDDGQMIDQAAAALREAGHATLAEFVGRRAPEGSLLAAALRAALRREIEADPDLSAGADAALAALGAEPAARFAGLTEVLERHRPRLEVLLATLDAAAREVPGYPLDIEREAQGQADEVRQLAESVRQLLAQYRLLHRELRLADSGSIRGADARQRVVELKSQFNALDPDLQNRLPALRNGLALLETAAGDYETAMHDFQAVAAGAADPRVLALVSYNMYEVALEQRDWAEALQLLERAAALRPEQFAPFPLAKYEPERILGVGASGVAFLCRNHPSETPVVVKAFAPDGLATDVADVFREARMLEEVDHPGIIKLRDCDFADAAKTRPYLVTDFFDGLTLAEHVEQQGPLPADDLLVVARAAAEAMKTAHERGILHRDLKPDHLLVRKDETGWRVKLIDFSIAVQPVLIHGSLTKSDLGARPAVGASAAGTIPFAAPEVVGWVQGVPAGPYSDVYSFGKTCYFALLGTPEPDDDEKETLPPGWRKLLAACTARSTARRLPNFPHVLERLNQLQAPPAPAPAEKKELTDADKVKGFLERGVAFRQQGELDKALAAFTKALQVDPNHTLALLKRGNVHSDRGEFDRALADYSAAIKADPKMALAYLNRGLTYAKKGDFDHALADANAAIQLDDKLASAHFLRGAAFDSRGDKHRAIAEFSRAIKLDPKNPLAYNYRGLAHNDSGDFDRAIRDFTDALRLDPRLTPAYINRGAAFQRKGNLDRAIREFTTALRLDRRSVPAYFNRGLALLGKKDFDRAVADFDRALQLDPRHAEAAARREEAVRLRGKAGPAPARLAGKEAPAPAKPPKAEAGGSSTRLPKVDAGAAARPPRKDEPGSSTRLPKVDAGAAKARAEEPGSSTRLPKVDPAAVAKARKDEAPSSTRLPKVAPTKPPPEAPAPTKLTPEEERRQVRAAAYFARGRTFYEQGDYGQAVDQFTKAIQMDPKDPQAFYQRGLSYVAQNEYQEAVADYSSALQINPRYVQAYYHRAIAHQLLGEYDEAIADYTRTLRLEPRLAMAYRHRGQAYAAKGDAERAKADMEEALRIDPNLGKK